MPMNLMNTFDAQLGYISLQQRLANDEVLAVAYQYTIGIKYTKWESLGMTIDATIVTGVPLQIGLLSQSLILKMLKSNLTNVKNPVWNLMMKIFIRFPEHQVKQEDFRFNILYRPVPVKLYY
jgi:cell surface protein SprA